MLETGVSHHTQLKLNMTNDHRMTKYGKTIKAKREKKCVCSPLAFIFFFFSCYGRGGSTQHFGDTFQESTLSYSGAGTELGHQVFTAGALIHVLALRIKLSEQEALTNGKQSHEVQRTGRRARKTREVLMKVPATTLRQA